MLIFVKKHDLGEPLKRFVHPKLKSPRSLFTLKGIQQALRGDDEEVRRA
jgi:hypothetical protein